MDPAVLEDLDGGAFLPPRLGNQVRDSKSSPTKQEGNPSEDVWREGPSQDDGRSMEIQPEAAVFRALRAEFGRGSWIQPILGEPGAGKSRLLREWAGRLTKISKTVAPIPLCDLDPSDVRSVETLISRIQEIGAENAAIDRSAIVPDATIDKDSVWLLDGLDEVSDAVWDAGLGRRLTHLPGAKIVTCRTAMYGGCRSSLGEGVGLAWRPPVVIQPLNRDEQRAFLESRLSQAHVASLMTAIGSNPALSEVATTPLLLALMAMHGLPLPATRAAFYSAAEKNLVERKLPPKDAKRKLPDLQSALDRLAASMAIDTVKASRETAIKAAGSNEILDDLLKVGALVPHTSESSYLFIHKTFQEFHLARSLGEGGLATALDRYWLNSHYEETLALTLALAVEKEGAGAVAAALDRLVTRGLSFLRDDPKTFFATGRSPTHLALHLLKRSGTDAAVWPHMRSLAPLDKCPLAFRFVISADSRCPEIALRDLANAPEADVRRAVARNTTTPPETLARLANDTNADVRWAVAVSEATPPETLARLANDTNADVRRAVAWNTTTPAETLARLADDPESGVRWRVARNRMLLLETVLAPHLMTTRGRFGRGLLAAALWACRQVQRLFQWVFSLVTAIVRGTGRQLFKGLKLIIEGALRQIGTVVITSVILVFLAKRYGTDMTVWIASLWSYLQHGWSDLITGLPVFFGL